MTEQARPAAFGLQDHRHLAHPSRHHPNALETGDDEPRTICPTQQLGHLKIGFRYIFASYGSIATHKVARGYSHLPRTQEMSYKRGLLLSIHRFARRHRDPPAEIRIIRSRGTHTLDCCCSSNKDSTHPILALTIAYSVTLSHMHAFLVEQAPTCSEYRPCLDDLRPASSCELSGPFPRTEEPFRALPVDGWYAVSRKHKATTCRYVQ